MRILKGETETLNQVEAFARYNIASTNLNNIGNQEQIGGQSLTMDTKFTFLSAIDTHGPTGED